MSSFDLLAEQLSTMEDLAQLRKDLDRINRGLVLVGSREKQVRGTP